MLNSNPTPAQLKLIDSLQSIFDEIRKPAKLPDKVYRMSCRGTISDNIKMVRQYICACGSKTNYINHTTLMETSESAVDSYQINCNSCGNTEKVSFVMLKQALSNNPTLKCTPRTLTYPYI